MDPKALFLSLEGEGGEGFEGLIFLHNTKSFSFGRTKKLYWRRVSRGFGGFI